MMADKVQDKIEDWKIFGRRDHARNPVTFDKIWYIRDRRELSHRAMKIGNKIVSILAKKLIYRTRRSDGIGLRSMNT